MAETKGAAELLAEADLLVRQMAGALVRTGAATEFNPGGLSPADLAGRTARWQYDYAQWREWAHSPSVNIEESHL